MAKINLTKRTESGTSLKDIIWHPAAKDTITNLPEDVRIKMGYLLHLLQKRESLQMPHSRSMSSVEAGVHELRAKDRNGIFRAFYLMKMEDGIYVFHAFQKKTEKTPDEEIRLGKRRLKELLEK